jgi:hypothetical protein
MDSKVSVWPIIRAHRLTLVDANTGRRRIQDVLLIEILPLLVALVSYWRDFEISEAVRIALLTVSGILAALLFGVMLQISERALAWVEERPQPGPTTSSHAINLEELAANSGYASLVCIAAAIAFAASSGAEGLWLRLFSAIGTGLGTHLILVLLMVMKRVFALTRARLHQARTGANSISRRAS